MITITTIIKKNILFFISISAFAVLSASFVLAQTLTLPKASFWADANTISLGGSTYIRWSVSGNPSPLCAASGAWSGSKSLFGSQLVNPTKTSTYKLTCSNSAGKISKSVKIEVTVPTVISFIRGDANRNGTVNMSDIITIVNSLPCPRCNPPSTGDPALISPCLDAADADDNGIIDISDAITLINRIFGGGGALSPPYPLAGPDPTVDKLTCQRYP